MKFLILLYLIISHPAHASTTRTVTEDQLQSADLSKTWSMPAASDTLLGRSSTDTVTNKTMSGLSNTFTNIPGSAVAGGSPVPVTSGGTGLSSITAHCVIVGSGTGTPTLACPGTAGNALVSNGSFSDPTFQTISNAPVLIGLPGSPTNIVAASGISFAGTQYNTIDFIQGSGGAVTVTANPQITAGSLVGQRLALIGESNTNTVTIADGTGLSLNGSWVGGQNSVIHLLWDGTNWVEESRR